MPVPTSATPGFAGSPESRRAGLRARRTLPCPAEYTTRGRLIHGPTPPGGSTPSDRTGDLSPDEVTEVAQLIADGRLRRYAVELPARLREVDAQIAGCGDAHALEAYRATRAELAAREAAVGETRRARERLLSTLGLYTARLESLQHAAPGGLREAVPQLAASLESVALVQG